MIADHGQGEAQIKTQTSLTSGGRSTRPGERRPGLSSDVIEEKALDDAGKTAGTARFLSVASFALVLGVSKITVYRAIKEGAIPAIEIRGRYVIPAKAIDELESAAMARSRQAPKGESSIGAGLRGPTLGRSANRDPVPPQRVGLPADGGGRRD